MHFHISIAIHQPLMISEKLRSILHPVSWTQSYLIQFVFVLFVFTCCFVSLFRHKRFQSNPMNAQCIMFGCSCSIKNACACCVYVSAYAHQEFCFSFRFKSSLLFWYKSLFVFLFFFCVHSHQLRLKELLFETAAENIQIIINLQLDIWYVYTIFCNCFYTALLYMHYYEWNKKTKITTYNKMINKTMWMHTLTYLKNVRILKYAIHRKIATNKTKITQRAKLTKCKIIHQCERITTWQNKTIFH